MSFKPFITKRGRDNFKTKNIFNLTMSFLPQSNELSKVLIELLVSKKIGYVNSLPGKAKKFKFSSSLTSQGRQKNEKMKYNELNKENYNIKKVIIKKEEKFENAPSSYEIAKSTLDDIISNAIDKAMSSEEEIKEKIHRLFKNENCELKSPSTPTSGYQFKNCQFVLSPPPTMYYTYSPQFITYNPNYVMTGAQVSQFNSNAEHQTKLYKYYTKLSADLFALATQTDMNNFILLKVKSVLIQIVKEIIQKTFKDSPQLNISFDLYGSFSTGLCIESSDVDILVKYTSQEDLTLILLGQLADAFKNSNLFSLVFPISSAKIPVIKLEYTLGESFSTYKGALDKMKIEIVKFDISFHNCGYSTIIPAVQLVNYIKTSILLVPISKCVIFFMKKFLKKNKMNNYYKGGISSYSLFILLFAFIKYKKGLMFTKENVGILLQQFLEFYATFDFYRYGINLNYPIPFFDYLSIGCVDFPVIIDPITSMNIGSGSYRIREIQQMLAKLACELKQKDVECDNLLSSFID